MEVAGKHEQGVPSDHSFFLAADMLGVIEKCLLFSGQKLPPSRTKGFSSLGMDVRAYECPFTIIDGHALCIICPCNMFRMAAHLHDWLYSQLGNATLG